ncbi:MAG: response regulator transcription factor [Eubacterium sp.]|jgi:DNA-binding LytR/AlgR family response regulator|nr:response regulator transcription factor [Eubacterium sp.]
MLNIAIVEDESAHADLLVQYIGEWLEKNHIRCQFRKFPNAGSFLFEWEENRVWDALFLDIQMPGINGVELARRIRTQDHGVAIVFTTGITDYLQEGYEVAALHYLVKPLDKQKVAICMERIVDGREHAGDEPVCLVETEGASMRIRTKDITYIEAFSHETEVHETEAAYRVREGIGVWQERLSDSGLFVLCHRSYLVNLLHVARIDKTEVILDGGERIPLSRRSYRAVHEAFIRFYSRKRGGM